jgi:GDP-L-fucose synthase
MDKTAKIYVAGHRGLVGSALVRGLQQQGYSHVIGKSRAELDLTDQTAVDQFFQSERPEYVFVAAAKVGGIHANNTYPAEFIRNNLAIQNNLLHAAYTYNASRLLFLGSSCIYPREAPQPIREEYLLSGPLEPTNRPYAMAKLAGIEQCWSYNRQYGTRFLAAMPTNLYGPGDNYDLENSHVIPALIRKFYEAKKCGARSVVVWGSGTPKREFLFSEEMAEACIFLMNLDDQTFNGLLGADRNDGVPPLINIGSGVDHSIRELADIVSEVVGFEGDIEFDTSRPDGTPRKLMDVNRLANLGWEAKIGLKQGMQLAFQDYLASHAIAA